MKGNNLMLAASAGLIALGLLAGPMVTHGSRKRSAGRGQAANPAAGALALRQRVNVRDGPGHGSA